MNPRLGAHWHITQGRLSVTRALRTIVPLAVLSPSPQAQSSCGAWHSTLFGLYQPRRHHGHSSLRTSSSRIEEWLDPSTGTTSTDRGPKIEDGSLSEAILTGEAGLEDCQVIDALIGTGMHEDFNTSRESTCSNLALSGGPQSPKRLLSEPEALSIDLRAPCLADKTVSTTLRLG